ncbi:DUF2252 domain-containing protein [Streptomyces antarcticus]|uniref:DUF2252 domain-containing protein n=1 Tax=Streptomyces antarcticus TaxID=2996458 RepID=UPI002271AE6C|nr:MULTISPECIES: DUF2252 domain-containing protein [unclassified Streptomyces]MCY0944976.1 DUF2252 domain-containing protein [Streptomyces sp. H34-AA3]MCY0951502.1 DUF2252 domain-containing protein [Streptomyces sp. H27-S2]MCZ4082148.1 DUF2252 domain-containing protein [Streptomyces sp. H34-S5]
MATSETATTVGGGPRLSVAERAAAGRAARRKAPRSAHGTFEPPPHRADAVDVITRQSGTRLQELIPIRYGRMAQSPFRFYRGAAAVMAADLAGTPDSGIRVQLCGDAHMMNFRLLGSPERNLLFDINDFDETLPGPWEWDVKRLAASLVIAGRENGFSDGERAEIVRSAVRAYRERMRGFARMGNLDVWYARVDETNLHALAQGALHTRGRKNVSEALSKARGRDSRQAFEKLTEVADGHRRFAAVPQLITPISQLMPDQEREALDGQIRALVEGYGDSLQTDRRHLLRQFSVVDMARKVVGVGSVGMRCWVILLMGRDGEDPLILQAKEAGESVLAPYAGAGEYGTQGERVVAGQRVMQAASDIFLGWQRVQGIDDRERDFYVRQLRDWKGIAEPSRMEPRGMRVFAGLCGVTLARAHARSGDRVAIAAYLGRRDVFDQAVARFAESYADRNERDHQALTDAIGSGRLAAVTA